MICADDVEPHPWRNGGGMTRELLAWPSVENCNLRIALADIDRDGPFSSYIGVERWIVVISGVGISLAFSNEERTLLRGDDPLCFDGADAPGCRLLDGPTRDLNLMVQGGSGAMRAVQPGVAWDEYFAMRGVFTTASGHCVTGDETRAVPALALLWIEEPASGKWMFEFDEPTGATCAWWLGFTPTA